MRNLFLFIFFLSFVISTGCNSQKKTSGITFISPEPGNIYLGDTIKLQLNVPESEQTDSIVYYVNDSVIEKSNGNDPIYFDSSKLRYGSQQLIAKHYQNGELTERKVSVTVLPQQAPEQFSFSVVNSFPHDNGAYTQGLEYKDGFLYESTGEYGHSSLRKVNLKTGEVVQKVDLPQSQFGEGLTIVDNKILQLTWREGIGLVYDLTSFEKLKEFNYQASREGWGICYDGEKLIKSDGSNRLYFLDKDSYAETGEYIDVYNQSGAVDNLNELEFINGKIYANIYLTDKIAIIDPATGVVEGELNLIGLLPQKDHKPDTDVLNGIAYDKNQDRIFVTGKKWNTLFEIKLLPH
ncbi:glutaminyl-peptide cyclotransferase [Albibacterium indicum]|uniref:glutaminyl-peptide cyclotransferase n=1 Tax=Albibacterium indicum TaxID=2292082 RepID=UPI000E4B61EF|nr:glutaminyl-peptide cyclotransferase [Pedobacter indicus]